MKKFFIRLLCCLIPFPTARRKIRTILSHNCIVNRGTNNTVEIIATDGTRRTVKYLPNTQFIFTGNDNHIILYEPLGKLRLQILSSNGLTCIIESSTASRFINIQKRRKNIATTNTIHLGKNLYTTGKLTLDLCDANRNITIGENCMFSWDIEIRVGDCHTIYDINTQQTINPNQDVTIGNHVWCGSNVMILKGSAIPDNCIIGTRSIVTHKFTEPNCIIVGTPARVVRRSISWHDSPPIPDEYMV